MGERTRNNRWRPNAKLGLIAGQPRTPISNGQSSPAVPPGRLPPVAHFFIPDAATRRHLCYSSTARTAAQTPNLLPLVQEDADHGLHLHPQPPDSKSETPGHAQFPIAQYTPTNEPHSILDHLKRSTPVLTALGAAIFFGLAFSAQARDPYPLIKMFTAESLVMTSCIMVLRLGGYRLRNINTAIPKQPNDSSPTS